MHIVKPLNWKKVNTPTNKDQGHGYNLCNQIRMQK